MAAGRRSKRGRTSAWEQLKARAGAWGRDHNGMVCAGIALATCAVIVGIFLFVVFSDFGGSADFIYSQF